jgi:hypothetical protein
MIRTGVVPTKIKGPVGWKTVSILITCTPCACRDTIH